MKILALYLPQFHRTKENDEWWGDGYTEWTAVKKAEPFFEGHEEPRVPLNENYYDLLDKKTMAWQADLMHKYGIDGMCMYHYYFKDGRKVLEKPAENLLKWKDIDMPFCFSWANESWIRSWSKIDGNVNAWAPKFDDEDAESVENIADSGVLLEQDYGDEQAWIDHFNYLLPFFKDERYILHENKPVFMIYKSECIDVIDEMEKCWNELAQKVGFDGIFFIHQTVIDYSGEIKGVYEIREPADALIYLYNTKPCDRGVSRCSEYEDVLHRIEKQRVVNGYPLSTFVGYDDSPRRSEGSQIVVGRDPQIFEEHMKRMIEKGKSLNSPFLFINAWNEWGEGMYLEPDAKYGYAFLEAIKNARQDSKIDCLVLDCVEQGDIDRYNAEIRTRKRQRGFWQTLDKILKVIESDVDLKSLLEEKQIRTIAVYGAGMIGKHLRFMLSNYGVGINFYIDRKAVKDEIDVYRPDEDMPEADIAIVTVMQDYLTIKKNLNKEKFNEIVSVDEFLDMFLDK